MEDQNSVHCVSMNLLRKLDIFKGWSDADLIDMKGFHIFHTPSRGCSGGFGYLLLSGDDDVYGSGHNCEKVNILGFPLRSPQYKQETVQSPTRIETLSGRQIREISIGGLVGAAVSNYGTLFWWGLCYEDEGLIMSPRCPAAAAVKRRKFLRVSCGYQFMVALSVANVVQVWGRVLQGDRFFQGEEFRLDVPIIDISCGLRHLAMLDKDGYVYTWGGGEEGQRGFADYSPDQKYVVWKVFQEACSLVKCGPSSTYCLTKRGQEVYACGSSSECNLSASGQSQQAPPYMFKTVMHGPVTDLAIVQHPNSKELVAACTSESEFYTWGSSLYPVLTDTSSMIEVFALWNTTPTLVHINCLPSIESPLCDTSYRMAADVLYYIYLRDRPEFSLETYLLLQSRKTPNLIYNANLLSERTNKGSYMLQKFLDNLTTERQIPPEDCADVEEVPNQVMIVDNNGVQNSTGTSDSQNYYSRFTPNQSPRPENFYGFMAHLLWDNHRVPSRHCMEQEPAQYLTYSNS